MFRQYVCDEKNYSVATFRFSDCTYEFLLDYIKYLRETKGYKESSINHRLAAIKSYLAYAADCDITLQQISLNVSKIPFLSVPKVQRPVIKKDYLAILFAAPGNTKIGRRDRMILILLFDAAIRAAELLSLKFSDVCVIAGDSYIRLHGKGDKERIVTLSDKTVANLKQYIQEYHSKRERDIPLFYTVINGHVDTMSERNLERIVKKYSDIIRKDCPELPDSVYPHMFRRTRATGLYQDGVSIELISRILGHNSTKTTRIYAIPSKEMLQEAMNAEGNPNSPEQPLWLGKEEELIRLCGLR